MHPDLRSGELHRLVLALVAIVATVYVRVLDHELLLKTLALLLDFLARVLRLGAS
jgi:hypothetical protein